MDEYELHQLAAGSRYEFDGATLAFMAWAAAFLFFCRDSGGHWSVSAGCLLGLLYLVGSGLLIIRCVAAMGRYGKQIFLLNSLPAKYVLANPSLQWPTLYIRIALFVIAPLVVLNLIRLKMTA